MQYTVYQGTVAWYKHTLISTVIYLKKGTAELGTWIIKIELQSPLTANYLRHKSYSFSCSRLA